MILEVAVITIKPGQGKLFEGLRQQGDTSPCKSPESEELARERGQ
jgi:hypothetical protein